MIEQTLILFDIDGTLLFSNRVDSQCFATTFQERYQKDFPGIDWTKYPHVTDHTIFREAYKEAHQQYPEAKEISEFNVQFVESIEHARKQDPGAFQIVPGAKTLFEELRATNTALGIGTGGWLAPAGVKLKHVDLFHKELIVSAADDKHTREEIVQEAIDRCAQKFGKPRRTVYVGDAKWDVRTCRNMGIPMIGLRLEEDREYLLKEGVSHVLSNYLDKKAFFNAVEGAQVPA